MSENMALYLVVFVSGEVSGVSFTDNTTGRFEWGTPQRFFDELNKEFNTDEMKMLNQTIGEVFKRVARL